MPFAAAACPGTLTRMTRIVEVDPQRREQPARLLRDRAGRDAGRPAGRDAPHLGAAALLGAAARPLLPADAARRARRRRAGGRHRRPRRLDRATTSRWPTSRSCVLPDSRRRGIGAPSTTRGYAVRASDGRTTVCGEVHVADGVADGDSAAYAFATALGFEQRAPRGPPRAAAAGGRRPRSTALRASVADRGCGYDVVTWGDRCPDEYAAAYCAMKTQMSNDVPDRRGRLRADRVRRGAPAHLGGRGPPARTTSWSPPPGARTAPSAATPSCTCRTARPT